jgi:hypothetical protein
MGKTAKTPGPRVSGNKHAATQAAPCRSVSKAHHKTRVRRRNMLSV